MVWVKRLVLQGPITAVHHNSLILDYFIHSYYRVVFTYDASITCRFTRSKRSCTWENRKGGAQAIMSRASSKNVESEISSSCVQQKSTFDNRDIDLSWVFFVYIPENLSKIYQKVTNYKLPLQGVHLSPTS